jgi:hypothetical protein
MIPLYGFLKGDTMGLLILGYESESIAELTEKLQASAHLRVPYKNKVQLIYQGKSLPPHLTLKQVGMMPLDRFDVIPHEESATGDANGV